mmetsp:Transcript_34375/g.63197  ORF Transcript_34375/g.63197 Transcript_34375/m.63197 type:complete len:80 (-) Transcript_34375:165-404(-)
MFPPSGFTLVSAVFQIGSENNNTPIINPINALHLVMLYDRRNMTLEHVAVVKILSWAKMVNMPAEMLRSATKESMFMAP